MKKITFLLSAIFFTVIMNAQCNEPSNIELYNNSQYYYNVFYLKWDANGADNWDLEYGEYGFNPTGIPTVDDHAFYTFDVSSNIVETSVYIDFYVRADCGGTASDWVGPYTFYNYCLEYSNGTTNYFENEFIPNCWIETNQGAPDAGIGIYGESAWEASDFANNSSNSLGAKVNISGTNVNEWLLLPTMIGVFTARDDFPLVLDFEIALTMANSTAPASLGIDDSIQLVISTDMGETWSNIYTWDSGSTISNTGDNFNIEYMHGENYIDLFEYYFLVAFYVSSGNIDDANVDFFIDNLEGIAPISGDGSTSELKAKGFTFYPNPSNEYINLSAKEKIDTIVLYNSFGQKVKHIAINAHSSQFDISNLPNGICFMRVSIGDTVGVVPIVKE